MIFGRQFKHRPAAREADWKHVRDGVKVKERVTVIQPGVMRSTVRDGYGFVHEVSNRALRAVKS